MASKIFVDNDNFVPLPSKDATSNNTFSDVIGNKTDLAANTTDVVSIMGLLRYIVENLSTDSEVTALLGALDTAASTGAVGTNKTLMAYTKQLVTDLRTNNVSTTTTIPALVGTPVVSLSADIASIKTVVDLITGYALDSTVAKATTALSNAVWTDAKAGYLTGTVALDSTVAKASVLGAAVGATISADIAAIKTVVDLIWAKVNV